MNILRSKFTVHPILCLLCFVILLPLVAADNHAGDTPVSYHSQIVPILKRSCQGCHHPGDPNGGLIVTTYAELKQGGMAGDATIVPGKPDDSLIIELISGDEPAMPQNMEPLSDEEVELFRRWILEGAHDDTPAEVDDMGEGNYPTYTVPPVVSAIAYSPDGSTLAISGFREVLLYDTVSFELKARLVGKAHRIQSLIHSADGKILGVAGGSPAQFGEVQLWDTATNTLIKAIRSSYDTIYGLSFSPNASRVAFGCSDQTVRVLSVEDEKELIKFDNHSDWVFGTVFSTDGSHFVSAGRDTALKLVEVNTGSFVDDINSSNKGYGEINTIARHPTEDHVLSGGEDRIPRLYKIFRETRRDVGNTDFNLIRAFEAQAGSIEAVAFSPDGQRIAIGSAAGEVRIYNVADGKRIVTTQADAVAVFAVSFHPNGKQVVAGGFDGKIRVFDATSGKLINAFMSVPIEETASADVALIVTGMT